MSDQARECEECGANVPEGVTLCDYCRCDDPAAMADRMHRDERRAWVDLAAAALAGVWRRFTGRRGCA